MSLNSGDLTTLATAQQYLDSPPSAAVLSGLITRVSRSIQGHLNRELLIPKVYSEQHNGTGTKSLVIPHWPLLSLTLLVISGQVINISPQVNASDTTANPYGYRFQPWNGVPPGDPANLELTGGAFYLWGNQNVVVKYTAGYQVTNEAQTIPATPFQVTPNTPYGIWATDSGVSYSAGGTLVAIASGTPTIGQYLPPDPSASPTPRLYYTFAAADSAKAILISYGFIPSDLEQVVLEVIQERASYRRRVGIRSQSLAAQESISYDNSGLSNWAKSALEPYMSVISPPIGANT